MGIPSNLSYGFGVKSFNALCCLPMLFFIHFHLLVLGLLLFYLSSFVPSFSYSSSWSDPATSLLVNFDAYFLFLFQAFSSVFSHNIYFTCLFIYSLDIQAIHQIFCRSFLFIYSFSRNL